jgi:hypothetical protein
MGYNGCIHGDDNRSHGVYKSTKMTGGHHLVQYSLGFRRHQSAMIQESKEEILQRSLYRDPCTGDLVSQQLCIAAASDPTGRLEVLGASGMGSLHHYRALRRGFRSGAEEPHGRAAIRGANKFNKI